MAGHQITADRDPGFAAAIRRTAEAGVPEAPGMPGIADSAGGLPDTQSPAQADRAYRACSRGCFDSAIEPRNRPGR